MKNGAERALPFPAGARIFQRMFTRLGCHGRPPQFVVEFYPYANLDHTIRLREETARARLSDLLRGAPLPVLEAAAGLLLSRLYRRPAPPALLRDYQAYSLRAGTRRRILRARRRRGRRRSYHPEGRHHNLEKIFARLNRRYFAGRLARPRLGWSTRPWRTQLGCFDPALGQIVVNTLLDRAAVPRYAVEYVLFHEMLHATHPIRRARCGLQAHSPAFRAEEKRFARYAEARRWLERLDSRAARR